jgi:hypothetical protein
MRHWRYWMVLLAIIGRIGERAAQGRHRWHSAGSVAMLPFLPRQELRLGQPLRQVQQHAGRIPHVSDQRPVWFHLRRRHAGRSEAA